MRIEFAADELVVTTTDTYSPRRIGTALEYTYGGTFDYWFFIDGYDLCALWVANR